MFFSKINIAQSFLFFFILLIILNPFLLIDPELFIFFSISLIIILSIDFISETLTNFLKIKIISYYYYYIRFFNLQLLFLSELSYFVKLNLFIYKLPFFLKWFHEYNSFFKFNLLKLDLKNWNALLNFYYFKFVHAIKLMLLHFYFNFFYLLGVAVRALFRKKRLGNYRLLSVYVRKHFKYKKNKNKLRNAFLIRKDSLPHLVKYLKVKWNPEYNY